MKLYKRDNILKILRQNITLFHSFNEVYLFGSILNDNLIPKDIDLLLIYSKRPKMIINELNTICSVLEKTSRFPIDLTVLSMKEKEETKFLEKLKGLYVKVK